MRPPSNWDRLHELVALGLRTGVAPAIEGWVAHQGRRVFHGGDGWAQWEPEKEPFRPGMFFDLASLTKALATTGAVMLLVQQGRLDLDAPVARYWPDFAAAGKHAVTIRHLLTHSSGLPAFKPFYRSCASREEVFAAVAASELESAPGTAFCYSDLGFIALGVLVERITGHREDAFLQTALYQPMGLSQLFFAPRPEQAHLCVATEQCGWRGRLARGFVHDENCYVCAGVSGHAGLFGTAEHCGRYLLALLAALKGEETYQEATSKRPTVLKPETVRLMLSPQPGPSEDTYLLGWRRIRYGEKPHLASERVFAHWGFTGTMVWADPERDLAVVLLTNRVHPSRENTRHIKFRARWVAECLRIADGIGMPSHG